MKRILFIFFIFISCKTTNIKKVETVLVDKSTNLTEDQFEFENNSINGANREEYVLYMTSSPPVIETEFVEKPEFIEKPRKNTPPKHVDKKIDIQKQVTIQDSPYSQGLIAYTVPNKMIVGQSYSVKIRITKENNKTILIVGDRKIPIIDDDNSVVNIESINISPIMSANLIVNKNSFIIDTLSTEYQNISQRGYTEWSWNIIPIKSGNNLLKLNVKIRIKEDGEISYKDIVVFDKKIPIQSNIRFSIITWIREYWQWFFAAILIPLIKWLYEEWSKKKNSKDEKM